MQPITEKIEVGYQFGPTIFLVSQDLPGVPSIAEPGPSITSLPLEKSDKTTVGIHLVSTSPISSRHASASAASLATRWAPLTSKAPMIRSRSAASRLVLAPA